MVAETATINNRHCEEAQADAAIQSGKGNTGLLRRKLLAMTGYNNPSPAPPCHPCESGDPLRFWKQH